MQEAASSPLLPDSADTLSGNPALEESPLSPGHTTALPGLHWQVKTGPPTKLKVGRFLPLSGSLEKEARLIPVSATVNT